MRNLDKARLRVKNGDNTNTGQLLKLSMFDIYNKLDKLMEMTLLKELKFMISIIVILISYHVMEI